MQDDLNEPELQPDKQNGQKYKIPGLQARISPVKAALIGLFGGYFFFQVVGGLLTFVIFGMDVEKADINALRLLQIGSQILFLLLPAIVFAKLIYEDVSTVLRVRLPELKELALFLLGVILLSFLINNLMIIQSYWLDIFFQKFQAFKPAKDFLDKMDSGTQQMYVKFLSIKNIVDAPIVLIGVTLIPALCEETLFRGFIQTSLELRYGKLAAAAITGLVFALGHFNPYGVAGLFLLGLFFGYAAYKTNSIVVPMLLHFTNNSLALLLYLIIGQSELDQNVKVSPEMLKMSYFSVISLTALFIGLVFVIERYYTLKNIKSV